MKRVMLVAMVAVVAATGCRGAPATGSGLYNRSCGACHGTSLQGGVGPALGPGTPAAEQSDTYHREVITGGVGTMRAVRGLTAEQVDLIIGYMRQVQDG